MAGYGRNVSILKSFKPKDITIVDIVEEHITKAERDHPKIEAICLPLNVWVDRNQERAFDVVLGVWTLSYMQEQEVDQFLEWCR